MAVQKAYTSAAILRMEKLCTLAASRPQGIKINFPNKSLALKLRSQIYAARQNLFRRDANAETPLATIETEVRAVDDVDINASHDLILRAQFSGLSNLEIQDVSTEETLSLSTVNEEQSFEEISKIEMELRNKYGAIPLTDPNWGERMIHRTEEATALFNRGYRVAGDPFKDTARKAVVTFREETGVLGETAAVTVVKDDFDFDPTTADLAFDTE
jgi:hypothetical protein